MGAYISRLQILPHPILRFGRGEAVVVVVLKPLNAALRDRDHIYATVSNLNQRRKMNECSVNRFLEQELTPLVFPALSGCQLQSLRSMPCERHIPEQVVVLTT